MEVSQTLAAQGASVMLLAARRRRTDGLLGELLQDVDGARLQVHAIALGQPPGRFLRDLWRLGQAMSVWRLARRSLASFQPQIVVGFGGWVCVPVALAARRRRLPVLLHEQNVRLGRANRFLLHRVDRVALSFPATGDELNGTPKTVTGLPVRRAIGAMSREEAARRCGLDPRRRTLLILGGSQGSGVINRLACALVDRLTADERAVWQVVHLTGSSDEPAIRDSYAAARITSWVAAHLADMAQAYALADLVVARAGASTIAELAQCGIPAVLIPYPYAGGHQRENARLVASVGGGICMEEGAATPERLLAAVRELLRDAGARGLMAQRIRGLARPDATQRLIDAIADLARAAHA